MSDYYCSIGTMSKFNLHVIKNILIAVKQFKNGRDCRLLCGRDQWLGLGDLWLDLGVIACKGKADDVGLLLPVIGFQHGRLRVEFWFMGESAERGVWFLLILWTLLVAPRNQWQIWTRRRMSREPLGQTLWNRTRAFLVCNLSFSNQQSKGDEFWLREMAATGQAQRKCSLVDHFVDCKLPFSLVNNITRRLWSKLSLIDVVANGQCVRTREINLNPNFNFYLIYCLKKPQDVM
jgi:hypothetical protein